MARCILLFVSLSVAFSASARDSATRGPIRRQPLDIANPQVENRVHRAGNLCLNVTNFGTWGNQGSETSGGMSDPCSPENWAPQGEFPCGSDKQYLFQAALWLGAEILDLDTSYFRVSTGTDGWFNPPLNEFFPGEDEINGIGERSNIPGARNCFGEEIYDPAARANQEFVGLYSDTLTDQFWLSDDPYDGEHRPVGLEVRQLTRQWSAPAFGDFIIFEFRVRNIGNQFLRNPYFGIYTDGDVTISGRNSGFYDDLTGLLVIDPESGDTVDIAYIADNDGRNSDDPTDSLVLRDVAGLTILGGLPEGAKLSYNWWASNGDEHFDFGPDWENDPRGTPRGDPGRLDVLSNGQRDYDQVRTGTAYPLNHPQVYHDPCYAETETHPWPPCEDSQEHCTDIANGYDTRFLYSVGPVGVFDYIDASGHCVYRLHPGEEFTLSFAYIMGRNFHDPANPQTNPNLIDPALFDFTGLLGTYRAASTMFESGFSYQPPVPPRNFRPTESADAQVPLDWNSPTLGTVAGYTVYRVDAFGNRMSLTPEPIQDTVYTATGLQNGSEWTFQVETLDDSGFVSTTADTLVRVGASLPVTGLQATRLGPAISLAWNPSSDPMLTYYRIERVSSLPDTFIYESLPSAFVDEFVVSGRTFRYTVFARNLRDVESFPSAPVTITAWSPAQRILLIDETDPATFTDIEMRGGVDDALVDSLYERLLTQMGESFDIIEQPFNEPIQFDEEMLASYDLVVWYGEDNLHPTNYQMIRARETLFHDYLLRGGKLIRAGRRVLNGSLSLQGCWARDFPERMPFQPMVVDSFCAAFAFNWNFRAGDLQFIGAMPAAPGFQGFFLDTAKVHALTWGQGRRLDYLPEIDVIAPASTVQILYRSMVLPEDSSGRADFPIAAMDGGQIVLLFPLYFMYEQDAFALLNTCIDTLRAQMSVPEKPSHPVTADSPVLHPNFPNPFNPSTEIRFDLPIQTLVKIAIFNTLGQKVSTLLDAHQRAGAHSITWNGLDQSGNSVGSGVYFIRLETPEFNQTRKIVLIR